ncbi:MAG: HalOD1 output domain-containing protein [Haloarculaceae archaeon]
MASISMLSSEPSSADDTVIVAIAEAIAAREGVDPTELSPPLYRAIDTSALESLFDSDRAAGDLTLSFTYANYRITVEPGPAVAVDSLD